MLDPDGKKILVPHWLKNQLRKLKLLKRNRRARLLQIVPVYRSLAKSGFDFASVRPSQVRASDPARQRTEPDKSGRVSPIVKILGK